MAHIAVRREDESGRTVANFDEAGVDSRIITGAAETGSCLRFIDPYGDFLANQLQLPVLVSELEEMASAVSDPTLKTNIARLIAFLNDSQELHTYVRFIGD